MGEFENQIPVPRKVQSQINKENISFVKRMKKVKNQSELGRREWRVKMLGISLFLGGSRGLDFLIRSSQYSLIVMLLWGKEEMHQYIVALAFIVSIPSAIAISTSVVMAIGQMLAITDDDISYTWSHLLLCFFSVFCMRGEAAEKDEESRKGVEEKRKAKKSEDPSHELLYDHVLYTTECFNSEFYGSNDDDGDLFFLNDDRVAQTMLQDEYDDSTGREDEDSDDGDGGGGRVKRLAYFTSVSEACSDTIPAIEDTDNRMLRRRTGDASIGLYGDI